MQATVDSGTASPHHLVPETTMDRLTPRPTQSFLDHEAKFPVNKRGHEVTTPNDTFRPLPYRSTQTAAPDLIHSNAYRQGGIRGDPPTPPLASCSDNAMQHDGLIDEYALDESEEEDMVRLANQAEVCVESHMPPSSLADDWDQDSRYGDEYDPNLQHSSLPSSSTTSNLQDNPTRNCKPTSNIQEDLLDDDVDWDAVFAITSSLPKDPSLVGSRTAVQQQTTQTRTETPLEIPYLTDVEISLAPFVRPAYPDKVRDRSPIPGLSSKTVLRTCFRIGEMISQASRCFHQQQEAVFELYARVTYSSRESLTRKQHFQFVDLFKDQRPYPSGTLVGWRLGSLLDRQSQVFVKTIFPKLCWCLCKPKRDPLASTRWKFEIIGIRETNWTQIQYAKMIMCAGKDEEGEKVPSRDQN
jgi:hypothetical protein